MMRPTDIIITIIFMLEINFHGQVLLQLFTTLEIHKFSHKIFSWYTHTTKKLTNENFSTSDQKK